MSTRPSRVTSTALTVPEPIRFDSIQRVVQSEENLSASIKRRLLRQTYRMIFEQRQELFRVALQVDKRRLADLELIANRRLTTETESLTLQIREEFIKTMRCLGLKVEMAQLEFLTEFAERLRSFRQRLAKKDLDAGEKRLIFKLSKEAFLRVADRLGELTSQLIESANQEAEA